MKIATSRRPGLTLALATLVCWTLRTEAQSSPVVTIQLGCSNTPSLVTPPPPPSTPPSTPHPPTPPSTPPTCTPPQPPSSPSLRPLSCADVQEANSRPVVTLSDGLEVVCDTETDNGGWIVIQRRFSAEVDFYRGWVDYKYGFGSLNGNFWLGLEKIHRLTFQRRYELRVDFTFNGVDYYAKYNNFTVFGEEDKYRLRVAGYSGNSSDGLDYHNDRPFSTKDRDNDANSGKCAERYHGAWWYGSCHNSNLNGLWGSRESGKGLTWHTTTGDLDSSSFTEMKIRPVGS